MELINVGGVCGDNENGSITNSYNTGNISGTSNVGGVCGYKSNGSITNSYNIGIISGTSNVGGVCGDNENGSITNSYNTGNISGNMSIGGVCGYTNGSITNSYNTGTVSGTDYDVGGVCSINNGSITNSYNTGIISGTSSIGGVCGYNIYGSITNSYYNKDNYSGDAIGKYYKFIDTTTFNKTSDQFASGEVTWLLDGSTTHSGKWGQNNLGVTGSTPTLISLDSNAKAVYKVTFDDLDDTTTNKVVYANAQGTVLPTVNPTKTGYVFNKWMYNNAEFTASTAVTSDITVTASYDANKATVRFISDSNQVIESTQYPTTATVNDITLPTGPSKIGYIFDSWSMTAAKIVEQIADGGTITVTPKYIKNSTTYNVNITEGSITASTIEAVSGKYESGAVVTVTANTAASNKKFSHWEDGTSATLGYSETYKFSMIQDMTLTAVYVDNTASVSKQPVIMVTATSTYTENDVNKISFTATRDVPDGFTVVTNGLIITSNSEVGTSESNFVIGASNVLKGTSNYNSLKGDHTVIKKNPGTDTWYARGYIVYKDANENQNTIYSAIAHKIFI